MDPEDGLAAEAGIRGIRIRGSRLLLRALQPGEIEEEWRAMVTADPMAIAELPQEAAFKARLQRSGHLEDGWLDLAIDLGGVSIGRIQAFVPPGRALPPGTFELGIELREKARNKGYGREALALLTDWLFEHAAAKVVGGSTDPANVAMRIVFQRVGWMPAGSLAEFGREWIMYRITRREWEASRREQPTKAMTVALDRVRTHIGTVAYRRAGAGAPLVLLHGGLSDGRSWTPQLESLAHEYDVVAWDAPGCGGSADPAADLRLADYADAVAALVRVLGIGPVHLAGHSFGAGLAIDVYGRHRQLVRSLVLSGAYAGWRGSLPPSEVEARLNRALAELGRPPAGWVDSYLAGLFGHCVPPATVDAARTMMLDVRPAGALSMLTAFASADLRAVLPTIAVPALLIYGAEDVRAPRGVAEALHAAIPGSRLILVPAAGHDVNLEAPQEYDAAVRAFLRMVAEPAEPQSR